MCNLKIITEQSRSNTRIIFLNNTSTMVQPSIIFILYILLLKQFIIHSHEIFIAYIGTIRYE